jgi:hypothetical protein
MRSVLWVFFGGYLELPGYLTYLTCCVRWYYQRQHVHHLTGRCKPRQFGARPNFGRPVELSWAQLSSGWTDVWLGPGPVLVPRLPMPFRQFDAQAEMFSSTAQGNPHDFNSRLSCNSCKSQRLVVQFTANFIGHCNDVKTESQKGFYFWHAEVPKGNTTLFRSVL